jgi:hypothetical protein
MSFWARIGKWLTEHSKFMGEVNFLATMAHVAWAYGIVLTTAFISGQLRLAAEMSIGLGLFAAVKEFVYDANFEKDPPQTFKDNMQDFCGYLGGIALAWIAIGVAWHLRAKAGGSSAPAPLTGDAWLLVFGG